ncbi:MAG: hypothetical protein AAGI48_12500 [Verrucomicrobiota bacterium]
MKWKIVTLSIVAFAIIALLLIRFTEPKELKEARANAASFKEDLLDSLRSAEAVSIVEHPWIYDLTDDAGRVADSFPQFEYLRVSLTVDQVNRLIESIDEMPPHPKQTFLFCAFEPHHTIELTRNSGETSYVRVCFSCRATEWEEGSGTAPEPFQDVFRAFIEPLGFQASRNWRELATQQAQQGGDGDA